MDTWAVTVQVLREHNTNKSSENKDGNGASLQVNAAIHKFK